VGHEAGAAAAGAGVQQPVAWCDVAEVVQQEVGLSGFQPMQLTEHPVIAGLLRAIEHGWLVVTDAVVVMVEPVNLAET
jgi:hypothetical protein